MTLAVLRFSDRLIPLAASLFADAKVLARHRKALQDDKGPKEAYDLIAAYIAEEQGLAASIATPSLWPSARSWWDHAFIGHSCRRS